MPDAELEVYAVFDVLQPPKPLKISSSNGEYYCYFPPPLPSPLVLFAIPKTDFGSKKVEWRAIVNIGDDDKHMGLITNTSFALCWNGSWTEDEKMEANTVQDKGRLMKLSLTKVDPLQKEAEKDADVSFSEGSTQVSVDDMFLKQITSQNEKKKGKGRVPKSKPLKSPVANLDTVALESAPQKKVAGSITSFFKKKETPKIETKVTTDNIQTETKVSTDDIETLATDISESEADKENIHKPDAIEEDKENLGVSLTQSSGDPFDAILDDSEDPTISWTKPKVSMYYGKRNSAFSGGPGKRAKTEETEEEKSASKSPLPSKSPLASKSPVVSRSPLLAQSPLATKSPAPGQSPLSMKSPLPSRRMTPKNSPRFSDILHLTSPSSRWGHTMCLIDENRAALIGGQGEKKAMSADSLWLLDHSNNSWDKQCSDNTTIERRIGHSATYIPKTHLIYIFGGSKSKKWYNDVHTLDTDTWKWNKLETTGKAPTRAYHSCTEFCEELLVFGGVFPNPDPTPDGTSDKLMIFDTEKSSWYEPLVSGDSPAARSGHSASLIDMHLYIFGGWDSPDAPCFNDIFRLDLGIMRFEKLTPTGTPPSPRTWQSACVSRDSKSIIYYGGFDGDEAMKDMFMFNVGKCSWTEIERSDLKPRAGHSMVPLIREDDENENETVTSLLIFGGGDNQRTYYNDLCEISV